MTISNEVRAKYDAQWRVMREERSLPKTYIPEDYVTISAGEQSPFPIADRAAMDQDWRRWRETNPHSLLSLEDFLRDYGKAQTLDTKFKVPRDYGPMAIAPQEITIPLKCYQRQAIHWLLQKPWGKILPDDMGLGKTIVTLAFIFSVPNLENGSRNALVVVPKSLLQNWFQEHRKACNQETTNIIVVHSQEGESSYARWWKN